MASKQAYGNSTTYLDNGPSTLESSPLDSYSEVEAAQIEALANVPALVPFRGGNNGSTTCNLPLLTSTTTVACVSGSKSVNRKSTQLDDYTNRSAQSALVSTRHPPAEEAASAWTDEVSPIFYRANFRNKAAHLAFTLESERQYNDPEDTISPSPYERIRPALIAATRMLRFSLPFFTRVLFAPIKRYRDPGLYEYTFLDPDFQPTADQTAICRRLFDDLAAKIYIFMGKYHMHEHGRAGLQHFHTSRPAYMHINHEYLQFFSRCDYNEIHEDIRNRNLFQVAATLIHELTHIVWRWRHNGLHTWTPFQASRQQQYKTVAEAQHLPGAPLQGELGYSWEYYMFGCLPSPWPVPEVTERGLDPLTDYPEIREADWQDVLLNKRWRVADCGSDDFVLVEPEVIKAVFEADVWSTLQESNGNDGIDLLNHIRRSIGLTQ